MFHLLIVRFLVTRKTKTNKDKEGTSEDDDIYRRIATLRPGPKQAGYYPVGVHYPAQPSVMGIPGQEHVARNENPYLFYDEFEQLASASQMAEPRGYYDANYGVAHSVAPSGYHMYPYGTTPMASPYHYNSSEYSM